MTFDPEPVQQCVAGEHAVATILVQNVANATVIAKDGVAWVDFYGPVRQKVEVSVFPRHDDATALHALRELGMSIVRQVEDLWEARDAARQEAEDAA